METENAEFLDELFAQLFDLGDVDDNVPDLSVPLEKVTQRSAQG